MTTSVRECRYFFLFVGYSIFRLVELFILGLANYSEFLAIKFMLTLFIILITVSMSGVLGERVHIL